jgi:hypothetical protein
MPPIVNDPTLAIYPSFENPKYALIRQAMINAHRGPEPLTDEGAINK